MGNEVLTLAKSQSQGLVVSRVAQEVMVDVKVKQLTLSVPVGDVTATLHADSTVAFTGGIVSTDNGDHTLSFPPFYAHDNGDGTISFGTLLFDSVLFAKITSSALVLR